MSVVRGIFGRFRNSVFLLVALTAPALIFPGPSAATSASGNGTQGQADQDPPVGSVGPSGPGGVPTTGTVPDAPTVVGSLEDVLRGFQPEVSAVLVIDVSGSMGGTKMGDAKRAAKETLAQYLALGITPPGTPATSATPAASVAPTIRPGLVEQRMSQFDEVITALEKLQREAGNPMDWSLRTTKQMRELITKMDELMKGVVLAKTQPNLVRLNPMLEKMHFAIAAKVNKQLGGGHQYMVSGKKSSHPDFGGLYATKMSDHDAIYVGPRADDARDLHTKLAGEMYGPDWLQRTDSCMESGAVTFAEAPTHAIRRQRFRGFEVAPGSNNDWMRTVSGGKWVNDYVVEKGELIDLDRLAASGDPEAAGVRRRLADTLDEIQAAVSFDARQSGDLPFNLGAVSDFDRQFALNIQRRIAAGEGAGSAVLQMEKYFPRFEQMMNQAGGSMPPELANLRAEITAAKKLVTDGKIPSSLDDLTRRFGEFRSSVRQVAATRQVAAYDDMLATAQRHAAAGDRALADQVMEAASELLDDTQGAMHNYDQLSRSGLGDLTGEVGAHLRGGNATTLIDDVSRNLAADPWILGLDDAGTPTYVERTIAETVAGESVAGLNPTRRFRGGIMRTLEDAKDFVSRNPGTALIWVAGVGYATSEIYDAMKREDYTEAGRLGGELVATEGAPLLAHWLLSGEVGAAAGVGGFAAGVTAAVFYNGGYWVGSEIKRSNQEWRANQTATDYMSGYRDDGSRVPGRNEGILDGMGLPVDEATLLDGFREGIQGDTKTEIDRAGKTVTISRKVTRWVGRPDPVPMEVWEPERVSFAELRLRAQLNGAYDAMRPQYKAAGINESGVVNNSYEYRVAAGEGPTNLPVISIPNPGGILTKSEFDFYRDQFNSQFGQFTINRNADTENLMRSKAEMFRRFIGGVVAGKQKDVAFQRKLDGMSSLQLVMLKAAIDAGVKYNVDGELLTGDRMQERIDRARSLESGDLAAALADFKASQVSAETEREVEVLIGLPAIAGAANPGEFEFAILSYSGGCASSSGYFPFSRLYEPLAAAVDGLSAGGGTPMTPALYQANRAIQTDGRGKRGVIVLLTDGQNDCTDSPVEAADRIFKRTTSATANTGGRGALGFPLLLSTPLWPQAASPAAQAAAPTWQQIDASYGTSQPARPAIPVTVSTIGFRVSDQQQVALEEIAAAGGGQAVRAENAAQLASAFQSAVASAIPAVVAPTGGGMVIPQRSALDWKLPAFVLILLANVAIIGALVWRRRQTTAASIPPPSAAVPRKTVAIEVCYPDGSGKSGVLDVTKTAVLGRASICDLVVNDDSVSGQHADLIGSDTGLLVRDLGSSNGTKINGEPIRQGRIRTGDVLSLAEVDLKIGEIVG